MKIYSSKLRKGFYLQGMPLPSDAVELTEKVYNSLLEGQSNGLAISFEQTPPQLVEPTVDKVAVERSWRDSELFRSDIELYKAQDGDPKSVSSVGEWRIYRKELRSWPEHARFPNKEFRPKAPDTKE